MTASRRDGNGSIRRLKNSRHSRRAGDEALEITVEMLRDGFFGFRVGRGGRVRFVESKVCAQRPADLPFPQMKASNVVSDPTVMAGKPVIAGTRITVELILEKLAAGETEAQILDA